MYNDSIDYQWGNSFSFSRCYMKSWMVAANNELIVHISNRQHTTHTVWHFRYFFLLPFAFYYSIIFVSFIERDTTSHMNSERWWLLLQSISFFSLLFFLFSHLHCLFLWSNLYNNFFALLSIEFFLLRIFFWLSIFYSL